ncbi:DNA cytosine methyltransferase [Acidobacteria bacterium AH-259-A15]|nr:DNA cytosine methyltransferase [Acidobacteria bacterium AH-259-A15]
MKKLALDMYSGTGGATQAFRGRRDWKVVTVDLDDRRPPDVVADCRRLPIAGRVDFLWASPPCTEFSDANPENRHRMPSLEHIFAVLDAIRRLHPRFWIMENVRGAIPFLGIPIQKIGPWCLWGYFPPIKVTVELTSFRKMKFRQPAQRAAIPAEFSEAVYQAVELYWDKPSLLDLREIRPYRNVASSRCGTFLPGWCARQ